MGSSVKLMTLERELQFECQYRLRNTRGEIKQAGNTEKKGAEAPLSSCYDLTDLQYGLLQRAVYFQRTGVGLEVALRRDQVHQLGGQVHVGLL
jgi:hypothetical protein